MINSFDIWFFLVFDIFYCCDKVYIFVMVLSYKIFYEWEVKFISWVCFYVN